MLRAEGRYYCGHGKLIHLHSIPKVRVYFCCLELKEGIIAAMVNQFTFMRTVLLTRGQELQGLLTSLSELVEVTSEAMHAAQDTHQFTLDRVRVRNLFDSCNSSICLFFFLPTLSIFKFRKKRMMRVKKFSGFSFFFFFFFFFFVDNFRESPYSFFFFFILNDMYNIDKFNRL